MNLVNPIKLAIKRARARSETLHLGHAAIRVDHAPCRHHGPQWTNLNPRTSRKNLFLSLGGQAMSGKYLLAQVTSTESHSTP